MELTSVENEILRELEQRRPDLEACVSDLLELHAALVKCFDNGGTLYTCGNGGSNTDAIHIVGELCKSFERKRPLHPTLAERLQGEPHGKELARNLESGLRAHALGTNPALKTAIENDNEVRDIAFAQELNVLGREHDVLLAISTSGNARNCAMAVSVARAKGCPAALLTGLDGGALRDRVDIVIQAPGACTKEIQEAHIVLWHTMCTLIEAHYFPIPRG